MTCTQVQRTLVKSTPELWAELSDPASLARHLGELGEIRITRIQPEQEIEWEAPEATGTVQIKSSGWGTRVTLTVNRELEPAQPAQAAPEVGELSATAEPDPCEVPQPSATAERTPAEVPEPSAAAEPEPRLAPSTPAAHEVLAADQPAARALEAEPALIDPAPLSGEARAHASEPAVAPEPEPPHAELVAERPAEPELAAAPFEEPELAHEPELASEADPASTPAELIPRRGLFARVLGRWRAPRSRAVGGVPDPFQGLALVSTRGAAWSASSPGTLEAHEIDPEAWGRETLEATLPGADPTPDWPRGEEQESIEEHAAEEALHEAEPETVGAAPAQGAADEVVHDTHGPEPIAQEAVRGDPQLASAAGVASTSGEGAPSASEEPALAATPGAAAEGEAREDDAAMLRSVLDRLGSAHHRPFSRG